MKFNGMVLALLVFALTVVPSTLCQDTSSKVHDDGGNCTVKDDSSRPDCPQALDFLSRLQGALRRDDRVAVAAMVHYPLLTNASKALRRVRTKQQLMANYDLVFSPDIRCMVLAATARDVWGNYHGFSISQGAVWFDAVVPPNDKTDMDSPDFWTKFPIKLITVNNDPEFYRCRTSPPNNK